MLPSPPLSEAVSGSGGGSSSVQDDSSKHYHLIQKAGIPPAVNSGAQSLTSNNLLSAKLGGKWQSSTFSDSTGSLKLSTLPASAERTQNPLKTFSPQIAAPPAIKQGFRNSAPSRISTPLHAPAAMRFSASHENLAARVDKPQLDLKQAGALLLAAGRADRLGHAQSPSVQRTASPDNISTSHEAKESSREMSQSRRASMPPAPMINADRDRNTSRAEPSLWGSRSRRDSSEVEQAHASSAGASMTFGSPDRGLRRLKSSPMGSLHFALRLRINKLKKPRPEQPIQGHCPRKSRSQWRWLAAAQHIHGMAGNQSKYASTA